MCHTALASCTGFLQFPTTDDLALSLKSYVSPPSLKKRRYTFRRMSHRSHSTLNSLPMTMINHSRYTPRRSPMITAIPIPTVVQLLLISHNRPQFRRKAREQRVTRTLPAPLRTSNISMTTIIIITILAMSMITTMVIITIGSGHHLPLIGVRPTGHPRLRMYTPMVIEIMIYFMHLTQVLYRLKVFYTAAFDPLAVQQPRKGGRRLAGHTSTASTETKIPMGKPAWRILRVSRDFQNVIA
jgi:hypothetical protein